MRMAVTATPSLMTMYGTEAAASFQAPNFSGLPMYDAGPLTLGSALSMGGSSFYNYADSSANFGGPWDLYTTTPSSIFNLTNSMSPSLPFSDSSVYSTDESDLPLMSTDAEEFFQQINGCGPISTMHPNLVSTLKNMVAPGPGGSAISQAYEMYNSAQANLLESIPMTNAHFETQHQQDQSQHSDSIDTLPSAFLRHCQQSVVEPKVELPDLTSVVGAVLPDHPAANDEPPKAVGKSGIEDDIEAAVVSVDLIKNKRPFRCQHEGCNKTFKNPQTMKMHHKTHYSDGSAASKECTLPSSLKAGHNKKIPSRCPKCKETFVGLYELRRHYGRKHSEGEKPFGCRKCEKKFYIEVDVRDHEKLCGEPIECKCGLKFAFKCNLVAHKKAHPACQDHQTSNNSQSTTSNNQSNSSSDDSEQSLGGARSQRAGSKRPREDSSSPGTQSGLPIPLPDFKGIPEAPLEFKLARHEFPALSFPSDIATTSWASNMIYPTIPTISFANLPGVSMFTKIGSFHDRQIQFNPPHCSTKVQYHSMPSFEAANCAMGTAFNQLPFKARSG